MEHVLDAPQSLQVERINMRPSSATIMFVKRDVDSGGHDDIGRELLRGDAP